MLQTIFDKLDNLEFDLLGNLERTIADLLISSCFDEYYIKSDKKHNIKGDKNIKKFIKTNKDKITGDFYNFDSLPNTLKDIDEKYQNFFIYQPYGKQAFPDFLIFTEKNVYTIEVKSKKEISDNTAFMMNGTLPHSNHIYVFGSSSEKKITYFLGKIYTDSQSLKKIKEDYDAIIEVFNTINNKRKADGDHVLIYPRKTFDENNLSKVQLWESSSKAKNEKMVKDFILNKEQGKH